MENLSMQTSLEHDTTALYIFSKVDFVAQICLFQYTKNLYYGMSMSKSTS